MMYYNPNVEKIRKNNILLPLILLFVARYLEQDQRLMSWTKNKEKEVFMVPDN